MGGSGELLLLHSADIDPAFFFSVEMSSGHQINRRDLVWIMFGLEYIWIMFGLCLDYNLGVVRYAWMIFLQRVGSDIDTHGITFTLLISGICATIYQRKGPMLVNPNSPAENMWTLDLHQTILANDFRKTG